MFEGKLDPDWYVPENDRLSFQEFRLLLAEQMLRYNPKDGLLIGDQKVRAFTQQPKKRRRKADGDDDGDGESVYECGGVTQDNFKIAKTIKNTRLCGSLDDMELHFLSMKKTTNSNNTCQVCGKPATWKYTKCNKYCCVMAGPKKNKFEGAPCAIRMHNDSFFGLIQSDHEEFKKKGVWMAPSAMRIRRHKKYVENLKFQLQSEGLLC